MENNPVKKKVLIVDDEEYLRQILVDVMDINDIDSIAVDEGQKALEVYQKEKNDIGLVLLDLILPKAFAALRRLPENCSSALRMASIS